MSPDQLLARAAEFWLAAETASTVDVRDALRRLAVLFEEEAEERKNSWTLS